MTEGLNSGDRIVTQGLSKIAPNQSVKPVPENTAQKIEAPKGDSSGGDKASQKKAG